MSLHIRICFDGMSRQSHQTLRFMLKVDNEKTSAYQLVVIDTHIWEE